MDLTHAKNLPISDVDRVRLGKRVSDHPLHDTFIGPSHKQNRDAFYARSKEGDLVAELDDERTPDEETVSSRPQDKSQLDPLPRLQRLFTKPLEDLEEEWTETASRLREDS